MVRPAHCTSRTSETPLPSPLHPLLLKRLNSFLPCCNACRYNSVIIKSASCTRAINNVHIHIYFRYSRSSGDQQGEPSARGRRRATGIASRRVRICIPDVVIFRISTQLRASLVSRRLQCRERVAREQESPASEEEHAELRSPAGELLIDRGVYVTPLTSRDVNLYADGP